jgi:hypothetical protein
MAGAMFPPGDPHTEKMNALPGQHLLPKVGISKVGIAAVDEDVSCFQVGEKIPDYPIDGWSRRDKHNNSPRGFQQTQAFFQAVRSPDALSPGFGSEGLNPGRILIIASNRISVVGHVQKQVAAHDTQAHHADFILSSTHRLVPPPSILIP